MKYLITGIVSVVVSVGLFLSFMPQATTSTLGAVTERTTISNPWTFLSNVTLSTSNTATSTLQVGCIQTTATSTATPVSITFATAQIATTTSSGTESDGMVAWRYGSCPI